MNAFQQDLQEAVSYHGHLCTGQILGVRMARMALGVLGIDDPKNFKDLIVYVECDRCLADAIGTVTGCKLGKRNLKWMDYGKSAATFLNLEKNEAIRISSGAKIHVPEDTDIIGFFDTIKDEEIFNVMRVKVNYKPEDLPGKASGSITCPKCNERVSDGRHVVRDGIAICKPCADGAYYEPENESDQLFRKVFI